jgi:hypothetical protein
LQIAKLELDMTKRAKPRWGEYGFPDNAPEFALTDEQAASLWEMISVEDPEVQLALRNRLNEIGCDYLELVEIEKTFPRASERNSALSEILEAAKALATKLREVDHLSQDDLLEALSNTPLQVDEIPTPEGGFEQYENLRHRLEHFIEALEPHLKSQLRKTGPIPKKTLPAIIVLLAEFYEQQTGNPVTHNPYKGVGHYDGTPHSPAGRFISTFLQMVDPKLKENFISTPLARFIKARRDQNEN